jgi:hypothetical protein
VLILESWVCEILEVCELAGLGPLSARGFILNKTPTRVVLVQLAEAAHYPAEWRPRGGWLQ